MTPIQQREVLIQAVLTKHISLSGILVQNPELMDHMDYSTYAMYMSDHMQGVEQAHLKSVRDELSGVFNDEGQRIHDALNIISRGQNDLIKRAEIYVRKKKAFHAANNPPPADQPTSPAEVPA